MLVKGLVIDLCEVDEDRLASDLAEHELSDEFSIVAAQGLEGMIKAQDHAVVLIIHARDWDDSLSLVLATFTRQQGPISRFIAIVCDAPSPQLMSGAFEFGVDRFIPSKQWYKSAEGMLRRARIILEENVSEMHVIRVNQAISSARQDALLKVHDEIKIFMSYDYLAAFTVGRAREALGNFQGAINAYKLSHSIYPYFRPAVAGLAENHLILGQTAEAWPLLDIMEGWFKEEVGRKVLLVCAALADGDIAKAEGFLADAQRISKTHPRVIEARVQILLAQGELNMAFSLLDEISDAGALFASRLNEVGIQLSQNKKGRNALALYNKAHRIVRPELKYKISLNAALAAHRAGDFKLAMKYVEQTEQEYGGPFEKLEKIKQVVAKRLRGANHAA